MVEIVTTTSAIPPAVARSRSEWVSIAALVWSVIYAGFGAGSLLTATPLRVGGALPVPPMLPAWLALAVGSGAIPLLFFIRRRPTRPIRYALWVLCAGAGLSAWSLLMDVATILVAQPLDSVPAAIAKAVAAVEAVLLAATCRSFAARRPAGAVDAVRWPGHVAAVVGTVAFVPYVVMKGIWVAGESFAGVSGAEVRRMTERNGASGIWLTLQSWGLDFTVLLAAVGVFLLWGLVRPWGEVFPRWIPVVGGSRVPRWLPITPALIGVGTLVPYGVLGLGYVMLGSAGVITVRSGDFPTPADSLLAGWVGMIAFAGYGIALAIVTSSYWKRTVIRGSTSGPSRRCRPRQGSDCRL